MVKVFIESVVDDLVCRLIESQRLYLSSQGGEWDGGSGTVNVVKHHLEQDFVVCKVRTSIFG